MTDLISRDKLLEVLDGASAIAEALKQGDERIEAARIIRELIEEQKAVTPQVVCNITGGLLQGASADYRVDVYTLDFDYDGETPSSAIRDPDGDEAWFGQEAAKVDPDWVKAIITAPTLDEEECGQCEGTGTTQSASNLEEEPCPVCDGNG